MFQDRSCVVAGNGRSLGSLAPGRVLAGDAVLRTNNFFFEKEFHLGRRVDLAYLAGDPRVAPFLFETLHRCREDYDIRGWTSHNPKVIKAGLRRFRDLYQPLRFRDASVERAVGALMARYQRKPMSGTYAVLAAHGLGAQHILVAGMDLFSSGPRYLFTPGRHHQALMRPGLAAADADQHNPDLDRAIFEMLLARGDLLLERAAEQSALADILPLAAPREGAPLLSQPRDRLVEDWAGWAGLYPIALLKLMRRGAALRRRLMGQGARS